MTAEYKGNDADFEQNLVEKENFVISKVIESPPLFGKIRVRAAKSHKLTTRVLKNTNLETRDLAKLPCSADNFCHKTRLNDFLRKPKIT